jgi:hypothetical protein
MELVSHQTGCLTICSHNLANLNLQNSTVVIMCLEVRNAAVYLLNLTWYIQELIPEVVSN